MRSLTLRPFSALRVPRCLALSLCRACPVLSVCARVRVCVCVCLPARVSGWAQDMLEEFKSLESVSEIPLFSGDHWAASIQNKLKEEKKKALVKQVRARARFLKTIALFCFILFLFFWFIRVFCVVCCAV